MYELVLIAVAIVRRLTRRPMENKCGLVLLLLLANRPALALNNGLVLET